jgi:hypothetical protein
MTKQLPATVMACSEYQRLLEESTGAIEACSTFRTEKCGAQVIPEETIDELLRLQTKCARVRAPSEPRVHPRAVRARVENCISPYKQETNSLSLVLKLLCDTGISFGRGNTHVHLQPA